MSEAIKRNLLRMDLQTFADTPADEPKVDEITPADEPLKPEEPKKEEPVDTKIPYDRFKEKVDEANALKEKLRLFEEAQEEEQRKELEDKQAYKELYEKALRDTEAQKAVVIDTKKDVLLAQAGYTDEQADRYKRYIDGQTDEELAQSVKQLVKDVPPKKSYIDPTPMGGGDGKPAQKGDEGLGKTLYERVMGKK